MNVTANLRPRFLRRPSRGDVVAGLSVALVLVPQSVAYAALAGLPPRSGLVVAAVSTIVAAPFVSAPLLQNGPTAVTSLLTLGSVASVSAASGTDPVQVAALLALLVGVIRLGVGASGLGDVAYLVSEPVLLSFTSAAGLVIVLSQLPELLGVEPQAAGVAADALIALGAFDVWIPVSLLIGSAAIGLLATLRKFSPLVPGVLLVVVAGVVLGHHVAPTVDRVGALPTIMPSLQQGFPWGVVPDLVLPALVIALVGFSEASAIGRSFAGPGQRWDADREFVSQGLANLAAGLVGGMPVGASFSRSAINQMAGASSAWSGLITGVAALAVLPFTGLLASLPEAVLAGIVVASVIGLVDPRPWIQLRRYSRQQFAIAGITYAATVWFAPRIQWAVLIGILLVVAAHLRRERRLTIEAEKIGLVLHLHVIGLLHFGAVSGLEEQARALLSDHGEVKRVVVHLGAVGRTDVTGALALRRLLQEAAEQGIDVRLEDITAPSRKIIARVINDDPRLVDTLPEETEDVDSPWRYTPFGVGKWRIST